MDIFAKSNKNEHETLQYIMTIYEIQFEFVGNVYIEYRNAHSITQQLRHRLRMVNCSGNRQH